MEETVVRLELGYEPEAAVSGAFLIQDEYDAFIVFNAMKIENGARIDAGRAVVELVRCLATKFGYPNDEALGGHPLYSRGLGAYEISEVMNSKWIDEQIRQNRVNFPETPNNTWKRHFVFTFHDSTFECLAADIKIEITTEPFADTLARLSEVLSK